MITHHYKGEGESPYDIDYPVPNFGRDSDIVTTDHSLAISEGALLVTEVHGIAIR